MGGPQKERVACPSPMTVAVLSWAERTLNGNLPGRERHTSNDEGRNCERSVRSMTTATGDVEGRAGGAGRGTLDAAFVSIEVTVVYMAMDGIADTAAMARRCWYVEAWEYMRSVPARTAQPPLMVARGERVACVLHR